MSDRETIKQTRVPAPSAIPELEVGIRDSKVLEPRMETLRAARNLLLSEYGPCAANHTELLIATARQLELDAESSA